MTSDNKPQIPDDLRASYEFETSGDLGSKGTGKSRLIERIAQQAAELATLRAENARLKAPVSDEEVNMLFHCHKGFNNNSGHLCDWGAIRPLLKEFVASRLSAPQEEPHAE
jgi:hypothetical protein